MPQASGQAVSLDNLLLHLDMLWERHKAPYRTKDPRILKADCEALNQRFKKWESSQASEARPAPVSTVSSEKKASLISVGCWPGKVDTYSDFYMAGIWNIARASRLLLLVLMMQLSDDLGDTDGSADLAQKADSIVDEIISSVPYHPTDNLYDFLNWPQTEITEPGRILGGLLMMHQLYVASEVPTLSESTRDYLKRCLAWISSDMGIGYAGKLAQVQFKCSR